MIKSLKWAYNRGKLAERARIKLIIRDYHRFAMEEFNEFNRMSRLARNEKQPEDEKTRIEIIRRVSRVLDEITKPQQDYPTSFGPAATRNMLLNTLATVFVARRRK